MNILNKGLDPLASNDTKDSKETGLKVAKEIASTWFNGGMITNDCQFNKRREWIKQMRLTSRGKQSLKHFQDLISRDDENLAYHNLDWRPDNTAGKYVNIVVNGIDDKHYRLVATANDRSSNESRMKYRKELEKEMYSKDLAKLAKQELGVNITTSEFVPENHEDLDIHMELEYKPKQEIAIELLLQFIFDINEWHDIHKQCAKDLVECGLAVVECYTNEKEGVVNKYVDIENYVHSYVEKNNFSDKKHEGVVRTVTVDELRTESGMTDDELREVIKMYASRNNTNSRAISLKPKNFDITGFLHFEVDVMDFTYKTSKRKAYKKKYNGKGGFSVVGKPSDYAIKKTAKSESIAKTYDTWYEGTYIIGSDIVYNWKQSDNIIKDSLGRPRSRFISRATNIYHNELHSFLSDIVPALDQIQITKLKLQHIIAEIKPGGAEIDIDMVANLSAGDKIDYKEIIRVFAAKGIVFKKRIADEYGNIKEGRAVEEIQNGIPANLAHVLNILQYQYETLREITGINPSRDGSQPHNALVGINEAQLIASNTITQHIADASKFLKLDVAQVMCARIKDIFQFKDEAKQLVEMYERAIGKMNMDILESMKNLHLHEFGLTLEMLPTHKELQEFENSMAISLQNGRINEDDMNEARERAKKNPKLANAYLRVRRKKNQEEQMAARAQEAQIKSQNDIASSTAASQNRIKEKQAEAQINIEFEKAKSMILVQQTDMLNKVNEPLRQEEYQFEAYKKQLDLSAAMNLKKFDNDQKSFRQNKNNTDQSKMIEQRKKGLPPINFGEDDELEKLLNSLAGA